MPGIGAVMKQPVRMFLIAFVIGRLHQILSASSSFAAAADPRYPYPFLTGDAGKASERKYDYIIVGGGTAGCPLAATLSQKYSVLVVERGDSPYGNPDIENESAILKPLNESERYYSVAQTFVSEDGVNGARGRVLSGSSALNGGVYSRASVEEIEEMRLWDGELVQQSYEWVEEEVAFKPKLGPFQSAVRRGLLQNGVLPDNGYTLDHVPGTKISGSTFDNHGKRHTAADHLKRAKPLNIVVLLNATAKRILFRPSASENNSDFRGKPRAFGVEFVNKENTVSHKVFLKENGEVILSAGALGSPQLLLLSGIGPSDHLKDFGIPVIAHIPGVGRSAADNPQSGLFMLSRIPWKTLASQVVGIVNKPSIYIFEVSFVREVQVRKDTKHVYLGFVAQKVGRPLSRGELGLRSLDPRDNPRVRYNYYSDPIDLNTCVEGSRILGSLLQSKSLRRFAYRNSSAIPDYALKVLAAQGPPLPKNMSDDAAMRSFCWNALLSNWHYHGGCNIGSVIDENYNVKGVDGLKVLDASTFRSTPGTNPQATIMMLGRYKGVQILQQRSQIQLLTQIAQNERRHKNS